MIRMLLGDKINPDINEIYRYMGYKNSEPDENIKKLTQKLINEAKNIVSYKACFDKFPVKIINNTINLGFISVASNSLIKNLKDCSEIILFIATIGAEFDRLLIKYSKSSPSSAVILNAVGTTYIEAWCDKIYNDFKCAEEKNNNYLRPRFSPGYGDLPLEIQKDIFSVLDCNRKIGVSLADSLLMTPSKSVSGIIGIGKNNLNCALSGCEVCNKTNCEFRRS